MMTQACPVCRAEPARELGIKNRHKLARCPACRHVFATALPGSSPQDYSRYVYDTNDLQHVPPFLLSRLGEIVSTFEPYRRAGRLLDVGFGAGALLSVARDQGWEVHGIEASRLAVEQARKNGFANAIEGDFLEAPFEPGSFDVIVAIELIEHLPAPLPFIRHAHRLLRPGGAYYVTTPNGAGLSGRLLGAAWSNAAPPEHLHLFSPRSLSLALRSGGFSDVALASEGLNPYELIHHVKQGVRTSKPRQGAGFDRGTTSSALNARLLGSRSGALFKALANWTLRATGWGDGLKAFALKGA